MINWIKSHKLLSILILVSAGFFAYYVTDAVRWIMYPHSLDYGEGYVMNYAKLWSDGTWKWDINTPPYLTMVYGVGYSILIEPLVKLFGAQLWVGRAVSFGSALVVCGFLYLIVTKLTGKKIYGLLACLLPATQPIFRDWSVMARVDMPAVMFDIIGIYIIIRFKDSKWMLLSIIPLICAVMLKISMITGIVTVCIYLLIYNRKRLLAFCGLFVAGIVVLLIPLVIISGGTYLNHTVLYQNTIQNIYPPEFAFLFNKLIYPFLILFILAIYFVAQRWRKRNFDLISIFFVSVFVINAVATLRPGSAGMYYLETILASAMCMALALPYVKMYYRKHGWEIHTVLIVLVLVVLFGVYGIKHDVAMPNKEYTQAVADVQDIMSDSQKPIISENPAILLNMDREIYIEYFIFTNMARLGYWDDSAYKQNYEDEYFDYVLLRVPITIRMNYTKNALDGNFTNELIEIINAHYSLIYQTDNPNFPYALFLYESNFKLITDNRTFVRGVDKQ